MIALEAKKFALKLLIFLPFSLFTLYKQMRDRLQFRNDDVKYPKKFKEVIKKKNTLLDKSRQKEKGKKEKQIRLDPERVVKRQTSSNTIFL